jgi:dynein heavy chain
MVRFGVMLVGPTLGGKTTTYTILSDALTALRDADDPDENFRKTMYTTFNPKAISMGELYGEFNEMTQEWTDGLGSRIMRNFSADEDPVTKEFFKWTVFDGPVDAIWIESMNTVLDDNMTLCLANGERIKFNWTMRMLFEVADLAVASPATVSRCGMVYLTSQDLGWRPYVKTWCTALPTPPFTEKCKDLLLDFFERYVDQGLVLLRKHGLEPVATEDTQLVISLCKLLQSVVNDQASTAHGAVSKDAQNEDGPIKPLKWDDYPEEEFEKLLKPIFCWAYTWTIGGSGTDKTRKLLEREIETMFDSVSMPRGGGPFDGYINFREGPKLRPWNELVPKFEF